MSRRLLKGIFVLILVVTAFHVSGIEVAFCDDDASPVQAASHGCSICQPSGHSVTFSQPAVVRPDDLASAAFVNYSALKTQEPAFYFFRPPITL